MALDSTTGRLPPCKRRSIVFRPSSRHGGTWLLPMRKWAVWTKLGPKSKQFASLTRLFAWACIDGACHYEKNEDLEHYLDGLRKAGLPELWTATSRVALKRPLACCWLGPLNEGRAGSNVNDVLGQMLATFPETNGWGYGQFTYDPTTATFAPEETDHAFGRRYVPRAIRLYRRRISFSGISCAVSGAMGEILD